MSNHSDGVRLAVAIMAIVLCGCSADGGRGGHLGAKAMGGVRLVPDPPFSTSSIAAVLDRPDRDASSCRYEWRHNGVVMAGEHGAQLTSGSVSRGDRISVLVLFPAGPDGQAHTATAEVEVANSPPKISRVTLLTATASSGTELRAEVESMDPDGDRPAYEYRWYRNNSPIDGARGSSLPVSAVSRGDRVAVEVVASDGALQSSPVRGDQQEVENHLPQFASTPTAPLNSDAAWHYQLSATDADGDALTYELLSAPVGMTMGPQGAIAWSLPALPERRGEYPVRIRVSDGKGGQATQDFTLRLSQPTVTR